MSYTVIAPLGDEPNLLFVGMKEFATKKVILVTPKNKLSEANDIREKLKTFTIETQIMEISENVLEEMFRVFGQICSLHDCDDLIVNVATGDKMSTCAALSAAYANGLKCFGVKEGGTECFLLPIMKLSYYSELSNNKMSLLSELKGDEYLSLTQLGKTLKMSRSLLSYHINGNYKYKGLKEYRLVDVKEEGNQLFVKLSSMGSLLLQGYIPTKKRE